LGHLECCDHTFTMSLAIEQPTQPNESECSCIYETCPCYLPSEDGKELTAIVTLTDSLVANTLACQLGGTPGTRGIVNVDGRTSAFNVVSAGVGEQYPLKYTVSTSKNVQAVIPNYAQSRTCVVFEADGSTTINPVYFTYGGELTDTKQVLPICTLRPSLPDGCCDFYDGATYPCNCETQGFNGSSAAPPDCPFGMELVDETFQISNGECECENKGSSITCYRCEPIRNGNGCNCADYGKTELGSCGSQSEVGVVTILIEDEDCLNYGTTIQCSECGCCCPGEDGCSTGDDCWCCPSYQAPWGDKCACVETSVGC